MSCLPMLVWKDWYDFTTTRIATSAIAWGIPTATATHVQLLLSAVARLTVKTKLLNTQNNLSSSLTLFRSKRTPFWRETRLVWTFYPRVYSSRDRYNFKTILQDLLDITTKLVKCALKGPFKQMCIKMVPYRKILLGVRHYFSKITSQKKLRRHRKILILTKRAFLRSFFATEASKHKLTWGKNTKRILRDPLTPFILCLEASVAKKDLKNARFVKFYVDPCVPNFFWEVIFEK